MSESQRVYVNIFDKEYQIACPPQEREALHRAAKELDARMRSVRNSGNVVGIERIAVMVALNLCHELKKASEEHSQLSEVNLSSLGRIIDKLDNALN